MVAGSEGSGGVEKLEVVGFIQLEDEEKFEPTYSKVDSDQNRTIVGRKRLRPDAP
jgi:hypothetical protein